MRVESGIPTQWQVYKNDSDADKADFIVEKSDNKSSQMNELEYYDALCREYPDITFRLADGEEGIRQGYSIGYGGSTNQIGQGFGEPGRCCIEIDVAVIRKMKEDPHYETKVRAAIKSCKNNNDGWQSRLAQDGSPYMSHCIEDSGNAPQHSIACSSSRFSSEEELKSMMNENNERTKNIMRFEVVKNELFDTFLSFVEKNRI